MNYSLLSILKNATRFATLLSCLLISVQLLAQKNAPIAGDAALLTDLLKKDYNTLDPDVRREQLAKDRTIVIGTLKRYLIDGQQENIKSKPDQEIEACFLEYKKAEQELAVYNTKFSKDTPEINKIDLLLTNSNNSKGRYYEQRYTSDMATFKNLITIFKTENQYLCYVLGEFHTKYEALQNFQDDQYAEASQESSVQKALPFIGGDLAFEVIIDGLSKFLSERVKEELTVAVIEKVQDYLRNPEDDDPLAELKVLLPRTQDYLLSFKASQMANFPDEIKQYIEDDLKHMPENLGDLGNTPRIRRLVEQYPELDFALEALEFIPNLSKIKNPVDFFDLLENSRNISRWAQDESNPVQFNLANTLKLSGLLAHSLTVVDNGELRMAGADFLNAYGSEVPFYMMYVGFLHQQNIKYYNIQFKMDEKLAIEKKTGTRGQPTTIDIIHFSYLTAELVNVVHRDTKEELTATLISNEITKKLKETQETFLYFKNMFAAISTNSEKVYASAQLIKKARKSGLGIGPDTLFTFIDDMINLADEVTYSADSLYTYLLNKKKAVSGEFFLCIDSLTFPAEHFFYWKEANQSYVASLNLHDKVLPYLSVARNANELVYDLQQKKYATAMIKALEITSNLYLNLSEKTSLGILDSLIDIIPKDDFVETWSFNEWNRLINYIAKNDLKNPKNPDRADLRAATVIYEELNEVQRYYEVHYTVEEGVLREILSIKGIVNILRQGQLITKDQAATFKRSIADVKLRRLVLSYYLDMPINKMLGRIEHELEEFKVTTRKGESFCLFLSGEPHDLKICLEKYVDALGDYLLSDKKDSFLDARDSLIILLAQLPVSSLQNHSFHLSEQTIKIIHFVNDMAKAENSDDVKSAIEAFALPAGSYSLKRQQKFTFSLNSYPGVLASIETTWTNNKPYNTFSPSFTAPVGLNFCWSAPRGMSHSIFVPVIDVGAFTRMYIGGKSLDSTSSTDSVYFTTLPEFSFMNLFSPGAYYALGFRKTPLSLYAGFQWGPYLREVTKEEGEIKTVNNYNSMRFSIGLVLDIPLWNIHSRSRL